MKLPRPLWLVLELLYAAAIAAFIVVSSTLSYEFMIGEVDKGRKLTICDLPKGDNASDVYAPLTGLFVFALLLFGAVKAYRTRRLTLDFALGVVLAALWAYRFFLRTVGC